MDFAKQITTNESSREGSIGSFCNYANYKIRFSVGQILRGIAREHKKNACLHCS